MPQAAGMRLAPSSAGDDATSWCDGSGTNVALFFLRLAAIKNYVEEDCSHLVCPAAGRRLST